MTADSSVSGSRAFIAYTTYNNTSSARLTDWIDTQFGTAYVLKVYKGDPNSGGTLYLLVVQVLMMVGSLLTHLVF